MTASSLSFSSVGYRLFFPRKSGFAANPTTPSCEPNHTMLRTHSQLPANPMTASGGPIHRKHCISTHYINKGSYLSNKASGQGVAAHLPPRTGHAAAGTDKPRHMVPAKGKRRKAAGRFTYFNIFDGTATGEITIFAKDETHRFQKPASWRWCKDNLGLFLLKRACTCTQHIIYLILPIY